MVDLKAIEARLQSICPVRKHVFPMGEIQKHPPRPSSEVVCLHCKAIFKANKYKLDRGEGKYCSKKCADRAKRKSLLQRGKPRNERGPK